MSRHLCYGVGLKGGSERKEQWWGGRKEGSGEREGEGGRREGSGEGGGGEGAKREKGGGKGRDGERKREEREE